MNTNDSPGTPPGTAAGPSAEGVGQHPAVASQDGREIETITFGECVAEYGFHFTASIFGKSKREQAEAIAAREVELDQWRKAHPPIKRFER